MPDVAAADLIRRIGGLETENGRKLESHNLIRRIGGLEIRGRGAGAQAALIRRIGGLESMEEISKSSSSILSAV